MGSEGVDEDLDIDMASLVHGSSKFILLKRLIEEEVIKNHKKILVFSGFNYALDCCEALVATMGIPSLRLDGNTCYAMRRYNIHRFQHQFEYKVFIMATRAGGEGITLTAGEVVVFLDSDWNPQVTAQAEARAYRIGQTKPVTVYKLCTRGTVEEQILNRVNKKLYLASKITDNFANANSDATQFGSIESDSDFIQNLIRQSQRSITMSTFDTNDLMHWSWEVLLSHCQKSHVDDEDDAHSPLSPPASPQSTNFNENERLWLSRSERVQTALFNGEVISRPRAQRESELLTDLDLYNRRFNKNRTVYNKAIDYFVSKESTLCKFGEAVPTLTDGSLTRVKKVSKVEFQHLKVSR
jgi:SWI/SNF-related matrix-associated actin-dependent regulator of chromatin subfamily A member 5